MFKILLVVPICAVHICLFSLLYIIEVLLL